MEVAGAASTTGATNVARAVYAKNIVLKGDDGTLMTTATGTGSNDTTSIIADIDGGAATKGVLDIKSVATVTGDIGKTQPLKAIEITGDNNALTVTAGANGRVVKAETIAIGVEAITTAAAALVIKPHADASSSATDVVQIGGCLLYTSPSPRDA